MSHWYGAVIVGFNIGFATRCAFSRDWGTMMFYAIVTVGCVFMLTDPSDWKWIKP